jgi:hypothetical protein
MLQLLDGFERPAEVLRSWSGSESADVLKLAFKDVIGPNRIESWRTLFSHLGIDLEPRLPVKLLNRYDRWLIRDTPSAKYSFDKTVVRGAFERDVIPSWQERFGWLYDLDYLTKGPADAGDRPRASDTP